MQLPDKFFLIGKLSLQNWKVVWKV